MQRIKNMLDDWKVAEDLSENKELRMYYTGGVTALKSAVRALNSPKKSPSEEQSMALYKLIYDVDGVSLKFRIAANSLAQAIRAGNKACSENVGDNWKSKADQGDYLKETLRYSQFFLVGKPGGNEVQTRK